MNRFRFLDSNICIAYLRGRNTYVKKKVDFFPVTQIKLPSMVEAELLVGALKSARSEDNIKQVNDFCESFEIIPFDDVAAMAHAKIRAALERKGQPISQNDLIIAATVMSRNGILITNNIREFSRIEGLACEDWIK